MPITLGQHTLPNRVLLAPLSGITDVTFRRLACRFGAALTFSEMVVGRELLTGSNEGIRRATKGADDLPMAVQLAGNDPETMGQAAQVACEMGADLIDINMGCPAKKVCNGYAGSALMQDLNLASQIIDNVVQRAPVPVTLKMRTGWDEQHRNAPELAMKAEVLGVNLITVHGRTRTQLYKGQADWRFVREVKDAVSVPVVINGDVTSTATAEEALDQSGADAVMIGRGSQGKPWLPGVIGAELEGKIACEPDQDEIAAIVSEHFEGMLDEHGVLLGVRCFRKHFAWYVEHLPHGPAMRKLLNTLEEPSAVLDVISRTFTDNAGAMAA
ncbi:MAG: tRNA dihydrouridine synthase DusB [Rhodospirillaceae bacterium]|nr:tRNA dihydrouridine synthase DusB [Rhodospirillaceae bacterium]|tara:strand:+ start:2442 stop:3425 length:984 start_codon:yes stop_codon:yes gene_type:complete